MRASEVGAGQGIGRRAALAALAAGALSACTGGTPTLDVTDTPVSTRDQDGGPSRAVVADLLQRRTQAVRDRDERAFLADLDPSATSLLAQQRMLFGNLVQFRFSKLEFGRAEGWRSFTKPLGTDRFTVESVLHRLRLQADDGPEGVDPGEIYDYDLAYRDSRWLITGIRPTSTAEAEITGAMNAAPWNLTPLTVRHQGRVTLAADATVTDLDSYIAVADEENARVAALWGSRPKFPGNVLFLSRNPAALSRWYGTGQIIVERDGVMIGASRTGIRASGELYHGEAVAARILVNLARMGRRNYNLTPRLVMRHEMVHAVTSRIWPGFGHPANWAIEGYAMYGELLPEPAQAARERAWLAARVRSAFRGSLPATKTFQDGSLDTVHYNYLLSWTVFTFVAQRKGASAATEFYSQFVQVSEPDSTSILVTPRGESICRTVLGMSSRQFLQEWSAYVRKL